MTVEEIILDTMREHLKSDNPEQSVPYTKVYSIIKHRIKKVTKLTADDIDKIDTIISFVDRAHCDNRREFCEEVLRKFNESKTREHEMF